ncbi:MAG: ABC transporter permease [Candidatus Aenigmarchaeota archaeon]|nr:ABC transporter permease [Candidatus Aenigmarchaeota archaeon]
MEAVYTVWLREMIRYFRAKERIVGSIAMPLFWLLIFGGSMSSSVSLISGIDYRTFITPGILAMTLVFTSVFSGISVIWDRELGFMKEMLIAPVSRTSIMIGKALGSSTASLIQATVVLIISIIIGVKISATSFLLLIPGMILFALGMVGIGISIASVLKNMEGFHLIVNFLVMPMFFLSGALFPISNLPSWLKIITYIDPMTYAVELFRYTITGVSTFNPMLSFGVISGFTFLMIFLGGYLFSRRD